jgi:predicted DNA-binding protein
VILFIHSQNLNIFSQTPSSTASIIKPERDQYLNPFEGVELAAELAKILDKYKDKRVIIVAPPSAGKSTLRQHIPNAVDIDNVIFDKMPYRIKDFALQRDRPHMLLDQNLKGYQKTVKYLQKDYVEGDGVSRDELLRTTDFLTTYINAHVKVEAGKPMFTFSVIEADVVIYLDLTDEVYEQRIEKRNKTSRSIQKVRAFAIKKIIEKDVDEAERIGLIVERLKVAA